MVKVWVEKGEEYKQGGNFYLPIMALLALWVGIKKLIFKDKVKINTIWFDGFSPLCREVKENVFSWKALNIVYNFDQIKKEKKDKIAEFWSNLSTVKATQNRLKLTKKLLREAIETLNQPVNLLSIASGSAPAVLEVVSKLKEKDIKAFLLDLDKSALKQAKKVAKELGIEDKITTIQDSTTNLEKIAKEIKPNLIEMVGFLEYRPQEKAVNLIRKIYNSLSPGGKLITSQILKNKEAWIVALVVNWPMIYRNLKEFQEILIKGGFTPQKIKIFLEPTKIHALTLCTK